MDNPSAFPQIETDYEKDSTFDFEYSRTYSTGGLSALDYFAAKALSAMDLQIRIAMPAAEIMAESAYNVAEAMLAERERRMR